MIVNKGSTPLKIGVTGTPPAPIVTPGEVEDNNLPQEGNDEQEDD